MPLSQYKPEWAGTAAISPSGPVEAGSWQSFELTYTAGKFGVDDQGGIAIVMRSAADQSTFQRSAGCELLHGGGLERCSAGAGL